MENFNIKLLIVSCTIALILGLLADYMFILTLVCFAIFIGVLYMLLALIKYGYDNLKPQKKTKKENQK